MSLKLASVDLIINGIYTKELKESVKQTYGNGDIFYHGKPPEIQTLFFMFRSTFSR